MQKLLHRLARWLVRKTTPGVGQPPSDDGFVDLFHPHRAPMPAELFGELKGTAFACASINASVCAAFPPRLFVSTAPHQALPRCATRSLEPSALHTMRAGKPSLAQGEIAEVVDHPLLTLFRQVNPVHNSFDM